MMIFFSSIPLNSRRFYRRKCGFYLVNFAIFHPTRSQISTRARAIFLISAHLTLRSKLLRSRSIPFVEGKIYELLSRALSSCFLFLYHNNDFLCFFGARKVSRHTQKKFPRSRMSVRKMLSNGKHYSVVGVVRLIE